MNDLPEKQQIFIHEYCCHWNGSKAAVTAGYSPKTARAIANNLLKKEHIQQAVKDELADLERAAEVSRLRVVKELVTISFDQNNAASTRLKGLEGLRQMLGYDSPQKHQLTDANDEPLFQKFDDFMDRCLELANEDQNTYKENNLNNSLKPYL